MVLAERDEFRRRSRCHTLQREGMKERSGHLRTIKTNGHVECPFEKSSALFPRRYLGPERREASCERPGALDIAFPEHVLDFVNRPSRRRLGAAGLMAASWSRTSCSAVITIRLSPPPGWKAGTLSRLPHGAGGASPETRRRCFFPLSVSIHRVAI